MFQRGQEKGAEPPALGAETFEVILREKPGEKPLHQVLGVLLGLALPADVGIERIPVAAAQLLERDVRLGRLAPARASTTVQRVVAKMSPGMGAVASVLVTSGEVMRPSSRGAIA